MSRILLDQYYAVTDRKVSISPAKLNNRIVTILCFVVNSPQTFAALAKKIARRILTCVTLFKILISAQARKQIYFTARLFLEL